MTALCAKLTAGVDLKRSLKVATVDVAVRGFQTLSWFVGIHKSKQTLIVQDGAVSKQARPRVVFSGDEPQ